MTEVDAWILRAGEHGQRGELERVAFELPARGPGDALVEPLIGSWEANMDHALSRRPVDVCLQRGEEHVVVGNGGVVRVLEVGDAVDNVAPGELAIVFGNDVWDDQGYMLKALAYDSPGSMGVLAKRSVMKGRCLIPIPPGSRHSLEQWAAFSLRYPTAWANWRIAHAAWRLQLRDPDATPLHVFAWGGGTPFAELTLARHHGARCSMTASNDERLSLLAESGITPVDRREFLDLAYDPRAYREDRAYRERYNALEQRFLSVVEEVTEGRGVSIFVDNIGQPVARATLKALGRLGVLTSSGWKLGMQISANRAVECIKRTVHIHTHFARYEEGLDAVAFGETHGWMPPEPLPVRPWNEIPELAADYLAGKCGYFPLFRVNELQATTP